MKKKQYAITVAITLSAVVFLMGCSSNKNITNSPPPIEVSEQNSKTSENSNNSTEKNFGAKGAKQDKALTVEKMILYAIQDEYLARGEYEYVLTAFGDQKPFNNIIKAEDKHIELLKPLFEKYKVAVPSDDAKSHLIIPKSMEESFKTGVQAEIENIAMYELFLKESLPEDVKAVFTELRDGSKKHLQAFENGASK